MKMGLTPPAAGWSAAARSRLAGSALPARQVHAGARRVDTSRSRESSRRLARKSDAAAAVRLSLRARHAWASGATLAVVPATKKTKGKAPATAKVRKPRKPKTPPRVRARWGVFDMGMKQVAIFDYNQRAAADEKLAELLAKKKGIHFLQIVKEPMPEPEPAQAPFGELERAAVDVTKASRPSG